MNNYVLIFPFIIFFILSCTTKVNYPYQVAKIEKSLIIKNKQEELKLVDANLNNNNTLQISKQKFYKFGQRPFPTLILANDNNIVFNSVYLELQNKGYFNFGINSNYHYMIEFSGKNESINKIITHLASTLNQSKEKINNFILNNSKIQINNTEIKLYRYSKILLIEEISTPLDLDKTKFSELNLLDNYNKAKLISPTLLNLYNKIKNFDT